MATATINGVRLFYTLGGPGEVPVVFVHGSWQSHQDWDSVVPELSRFHRTLTYDRRGHSRSERVPAQGSIREDVADLAALIEHAGLAPAWVVGNSFGAAITLGLVRERPDLLRGAIVHEPPLMGLVADDPDRASILQEVGPRIAAVVERIVAGDHAGAAQSPPLFASVVARLAGALPRREVATFAGAGHIPHVTHPEAYVRTTTTFIQTAETRGARPQP